MVFRNSFFQYIQLESELILGLGFLMIIGAQLLRYLINTSGKESTPRPLFKDVTQLSER
jgi:hypothetical protein